MKRFGRVLLAVLIPGCMVLSGVARAESAPEGLEIRIAPADFLTANKARHVSLGYQGVSPYYDFVLQTVYFIDHGQVPLTLEVLAAGDRLSAESQTHG